MMLFFFVWVLENARVMYDLRTISGPVTGRMREPILISLSYLGRMHGLRSISAITPARMKLGVRRPCVILFFFFG